MVKNVLTIDKALEIANVPKDANKVLQETDSTERYKLINRYYNERGDIDPKEYVIKTKNDSEVIKSTLGYPIDQSLNIESIEPMNLHHSHFSSEGLKKSGVDRKNSWNGEKAAFIYEDGTLKIIKSDYYTTYTYSSLPHVEVGNVIEKYDNVQDVPLDELSLRESYLKNKEHFNESFSLCTGGSVGGVIMSNNGESWELILGRRSKKTNINPDRISIVPNGALEYDHMCEEGFRKDLKMNFNEELFRGRKQPNFFKEFIDTYMVSSGWNLRTGELSVGYALIIDDPDGHKQLINTKNQNFEFSELVRIDANNFTDIKNKINIDKSAPSTIPAIFQSLVLLQNIKDNFDPNYSIMER